MKNQKPILLIDMDGVITDYYKGFTTELLERLPEINIIPPEKLKDFYVEMSYLEVSPSLIEDITRSEGFFFNLEPMPGAVEALNSILEQGEFEPFICTAPELDAEDQCCFSEKALWVEKHLGRKWLKRLIITKDKTIINGDYLIDDKPFITGVKSGVKGFHDASWERITFNWYYNRSVSGYRLINWNDWDRLSKEISQDRSNL